MSSDHPTVDAAWQLYLKDRNRERLIASAAQESNQRGVLQLFLWRAIGVGDWELVKALEDHQVALPNDEDCTPGLVYMAVDDLGDVPHAIEWLVNHGAQVDARGPNDWTALHLACRSGYLGTVAALVRNNADVNAQTTCDGGWTPLMEACASGKKDIVEFLLAHGADPETWNLLEGASARGIADSRGHSEIVELLDICSGADPGERI